MWTISMVGYLLNDTGWYKTVSSMNYNLTFDFNLSRSTLWNFFFRKITKNSDETIKFTLNEIKQNSHNSLKIVRWKTRFYCETLAITRVRALNITQIVVFFSMRIAYARLHTNNTWNIKCQITLYILQSVNILCYR